jgi:hypothetical protein
LGSIDPVYMDQAWTELLDARSQSTATSKLANL